MNDTILVLVIIAIFAVLLFGLSYLKKLNKSFTFRVIAALLIGLVFGALLQMLLGFGNPIIKTANDWMGLVGSGYVRMLRMIVMPLIFVSILSAFITQKSANLGKVAGRVLAVLVVTVAISALVGALTTNAFGLTAEGVQVGQAEQQRGEALDAQLETFSQVPIQQQILEIIPTNPFAALAGTGSNATLSTVFFSTMLAIAAIQIRKFKPESAKFFEDLTKSLHDVIMRLVNLIMRFTPYGILALMTKVASTSNVSDIVRLLKFILASYVAILIMFIVHFIILALVGLNPVQFLKKSANTLLFAFTSRTSAGTLPMTIRSQMDLGVPEEIGRASCRERV